MFEKPEEQEKHPENDLNQQERNLHRNFRPGSQAPETTEIDKKELQRQMGYGSKFQGDIGEGVTLRVASDKLGLTPDPRFDQAKHGFDTVFRDPEGRLVVIEAKYDERGIKALEGDQMQPSWVERNAGMMQDPGNERFTEGNAKIGREILKVGAENIRRIVIATDSSTLRSTAYEGQADGSWKQIGSWSVLDLEQPYLEE